MKPLFAIPQRASKEQTLQLAKKASQSGKKAVTTVKRSGGGLADVIAQIKALVLSKLGKYEDETLLIQDEDTLHDYISKAIQVGEIAIDTETTGLDPLLDKCVGVCLYTEGEKTAYVPMNHVSYITGERCPNQLDAEVLRVELERLNEHSVDVDMFNAPFDIRVVKKHIGVVLKCTWDCYVGARLLNDNERAEGCRNKLKPLHQKYCLDGVGDAFSFDDLFDKVTFDKIPINVGYLYAAHDAKITWELKKFQEKYIYYEPECEFSDRNGMNGVSWTFFNVEMPIIPVVVDMEDVGTAFDLEYTHTLSVKYNAMLEEREKAFHNACYPYLDAINEKRIQGAKLDDPINIGSPLQLAILLYDIIGLDAGTDKKTGKPIRGTGDEILGKLDHPVVGTIREYREVSKLISTYIDKLPNCVNPNDGRIHCKFNQYGADTRRFSSSNPNLQNIPSHNKDIRPMFVASDGYVMMSSDFSQQEPKCLAALCRQAGDPQMYDTFMEGKDLYSEIASKSFNKPYEECREFDENGNKNPKEYKERRTQAKSILLGVLYGRGIPSIAEQLGCEVDKAREIKESVFKGFPAIKQFEEDSLQFAHEFGYVTTVCGRKRRLPDLMLDEFEFDWESGYAPEGDILDFDDFDVEVPYAKQMQYLNKLDRLRGMKKRAEKLNLISNAKKYDHIIIKDNGAKIADATRQCVNARIQGSAADLTKLAMIELHNNEELRELGFRMLIPVHDEIIAECPEKNAKRCAELLAQTMSRAAERVLEMPIKCDVEVTRAWYGEEVKL